MYWLASMFFPGMTVFCLILAAFSYVWYKKQIRLLSMTTETSGSIVKLVEPKINPKQQDPEPVYRIWTEYTVNEKKYKTYMYRKASAASYQEGQEMLVIYDPDNPSRAVAKDFEDAKNYWLVFPIACLTFAAVFAMLFIYTLPDVLNMSEKNKTIYKIVFNLFFSAASVVLSAVYICGGFYRREKEKNPKNAKSFIAVMAVIFAETLFDAVFDIIFKL